MDPRNISFNCDICSNFKLKDTIIPIIRLNKSCVNCLNCSMIGVRLDSIPLPVVTCINYQEKRPKK